MLEKTLNETILEIAKTHNLDIVELIIGYKTIRLSLENPDGSSVTLETCVKITKGIKCHLKEQGILDWGIEVGSAGVNRPLKTLADYQKFIGRLVKIELNHILLDLNLKRIHGYISLIKDNLILIKEQKTNAEIWLDMANIKKSNLKMQGE